MREPPDLRVLIVEDQALLAMELELVLADAGCEVVGAAADRRAALAAAERERPDMALVDVNLLDGSTGPHIARTLVSRFDVAVVFLTANPEQIPVGFAGALGAVSKPFDEHTIHAVVDLARDFVRHRRIGQPPSRLRLAPWITSPPTGPAPH